MYDLIMRKGKGKFTVEAISDKGKGLLQRYFGGRTIMIEMPNSFAHEVALNAEINCNLDLRFVLE
mgnify:CR=1 FL=1